MNSVVTNGPSGPGNEGSQDAVKVRIGESRLARTPCRLTTAAIGSCIAVCLYDRARKTGCLCHSLLPSPSDQKGERSARYTTDAILMMVDLLKAEGALPANLEAKLVGGASLFGSFEGSETLSIGVRNAEAARSCLMNLGISIVAEDVGGGYGRSVEFSTEDGVVTVRSARAGERIL